MKELDEIKFYEIPKQFERDSSAEAEELLIKMSKARGLLHFDLPFFGFLLTQLEIYPVRNEPQVQSFAMDTRRFYVDVDYFKKMKPAKMRAVLLHAIIHLIMKHGERSKGHNKEVFSIASDINAHLMVNNSLYDQHLDRSTNKYDVVDVSKVPSNLKNNDVEHINQLLYDFANAHLSEDAKKISPSQKQFSQEVLGDLLEYANIPEACNYIDNYDKMMNGMSKELRMAEENRFMGLMKYAYEQARRQGKLPASLKDYIEGLLEPRIPWYTYLEQYIQRSIITDYRWVPPNRRYINQNIILPSTDKENIEVIIALDTSGSITNDELMLFLSESMSIFNSFGNINMTVIQCDAAIQHSVHIESGETLSGEDLPWQSGKIYGRGGTSFVPVFEYVEEKEISPSVLLYFTDGYGTFPAHQPEYDTIWVMTTEVEAPFGYLIRYHTEDNRF
ncbi:MAG: hypothetical protein INQ03_18670 [Candidatus Heimdallarchaeota archaeon]|nr:hypothetical protein [Candidatus Heimdallarchaeota archaeon]